MRYLKKDKHYILNDYLFCIPFHDTLVQMAQIDLKCNIIMDLAGFLLSHSTQGFTCVLYRFKSLH